MPSPLLDKYLPKYNYPGFRDFIYGQDRKSDPMDDLFQKAAEHQVEKEGEDQNAFFTFLDYMARPQRAVAGVIKDMMDGGDFSPLDRVGKALAGQEKYGIKEVIDVIAPGTWYKTQLPDWLGGKPIDLPKEVIGFMGDIMTDPLMSVRLFTHMGKMARFGGSEMKFLRELAAAEEGRMGIMKAGSEFKGTVTKPGFISSRLVDAVQTEQKSLGVGLHMMGAYSKARAETRELYELWKKAVDNPVEFQHALKSKEAKAMFAEAVDPKGKFRDPRVANLLRGDPAELAAESFLGPRAAPFASQRFAKGEASMIAFKMPWLMRKLGIPDGKWSMIPKLDEKWGTALARGYENLTAQVMNTKVGVQTKKVWDKIFRFGTGNEVADMTIAQGMAQGLREADEATAFGREMRDAFQGHFTKENLDLVAKHTIHRKNVEGAILDIPEDVNGFPLRKVVESISNILDKRAGIHNSIPGIQHRLIGGQFSEYQAWKALESAYKQRGFKYSGMTSFATLKRIANTRAEKIADEFARNLDNATISKKDVHGFYKTEFGKLIKEEQDKAAVWLGDLHAMKPAWETGYLPRMMTDEAKDLLEQVIMSPKIFVKTPQGMERAGNVWMANTRGRSLKEFDHFEFNRMLAEGKFPYDFMDQIFAQARRNLSGKELKAWQKFLGAVDETHLKMYMEDPLRATFQYVASSQKAVSKQRGINEVARLFLRPIMDDSQQALGERYVLLTRDGMEAMYGKEWRNILGENAVKVYEEHLKKAQIKSMQGMGGLLASVENIGDLAQLRSFGVPTFSTSSDLLDGMNRFHSLLNNPEEWRGVLGVWHSVTNMWKKSTLFLFPSYHMRNFFSAFWQTAFADTMEVAGYQYANKIFTAKRAFMDLVPEKWRPKSLGLARPAANADELTVAAEKTWNKQAYTMEQAWDDMRKHGVLTSSWYAREIMQNAKGEYWKTGLAKASAPKAIATKVGKLFDWGASVGNFSDNWHRVAHYITQIRRGQSPYNAAKSVKKYFFDYGELGLVEKALFRNVFPFYTWTRKNIPLQLEFLMTNPGAFANLQRMIEFIQSPEAQQFDRRQLPKWVSEAGGFPTRINPKTGDLEVKLLSSYIPAADLGNMMSLKSIFLQTPGEMLHPIPKLAAERMFNRSFYTGHPIENYPGEKADAPFLGMDMDKKTVHTLKTIRLASAANDLTTGYRPGGEVGLSSRIAEFFAISPKTKAFDLERLEYSRKRQIAERKGILKRGHYTAKKVDDKRGIRYLQRIKSEAGADL